MSQTPTKKVDPNIAVQEKRVEKQLVQLVLTQSFFATLLLRMKIEPNNAPWNPTMCTDGEYIHYNTDFCKTLSDGEIRGVLVHEVLHPTLGHLWRRGSRDPLKWNIAADHQVNLFIEAVNAEAKSGGKTEPLPLPKIGLCCDKKYEGMGSEETYARLPKPPKGSTSCAVGIGQFTDPKKGDGKGEGNNTEAGWAVAVAQAAQASKMCGNQSACIDRFVGKLIKPTVPWQQVLENFVSASAADDYDWTKFDRRYIEQGFYLPDLYSECVGELAVIIDTSGSIDNDTMNKFASELQELMVKMRPSKLVVHFADTEICHTQEIEGGDPIDLKPKGCGGTDFCKPLKHVAKRGILPECLIYLTDLYGTFPKEAPPYPLIWVVTPTGDTRTPPFGECVRMQ